MLVGSRKPGQQRRLFRVWAACPPCSFLLRAPTLRTAVAVVVEVEVAVLCQSLPKHQVVGDVSVTLGGWLPAHEEVGGGV